MSDTVTIVEPSPVNRRRWLRSLRIAVSVFFGVVTVSLCALWMRSYWWLDAVQVGFGGRDTGHIQSFEGRVTTFRFELWRQRGRQTFGSVPAKWVDSTQARREAYTGGPDWVAIKRTPSVIATIPHWLCAMFATVLAVSPWICWRFSLRTMLIATTLVAVLLGLGVWLAS